MNQMGQKQRGRQRLPRGEKKLQNEEKEEREREREYERSLERHYGSPVLLTGKGRTGDLLLKSHSSLYCLTLSMERHRDNAERSRESSLSQCHLCTGNTGVLGVKGTGGHTVSVANISTGFAKHIPP